MAEVTLAMAWLASVVCVLAYLRERDERRAKHRLDLLNARAAATKGDAVTQLDERVRRLEQRGLAAR